MPDPPSSSQGVHSIWLKRYATVTGTPGIVVPRIWLKSPVWIAGVDVIQYFGRMYVRARDLDGAEGWSQCGPRLRRLVPVILEDVIPFFLGKDARDIEVLLRNCYVSNENYRNAGHGFWNCLGAVELALWDLMARRAKLPVWKLLGTPLRKKIPVCLSRHARSNEVEDELDIVQQSADLTGVTAVKLAVGGRMSQNIDTSPGRSEKLIRSACERFAGSKEIYADADGSFDVEGAVLMGRYLESYGISWFEEPVPWEDFEACGEVASQLDIPIAVGEEISSLPMFAWYARHHGATVLQPDVQINGGLVRCLTVAKIAESCGLRFAPVGGSGMRLWPAVHLAAVVPNLARHIEVEFDMAIKNGVVEVPEGLGWGVEVDPEIARSGEFLRV